MKYLKIDNKEVMPIISFGVYQIRDLELCETAVLQALEIGYRGIDTAQVYANEEAVGEALSKTNVKREDIFLTTKVWISNYRYDDTIKSIEVSLKKLQTSYIDLVLIHQPFGPYYEAYRALEDLQDKKIIKYIGISNFSPNRLVDLSLFSRKKPQVNQIEMHPFFQQKEAIKWNEKYGVIPQAWAPFAEGKNDIFTNSVLKKIGDKYKKTPAQVILRWLIELNIPFAVKSVNQDRIKQNFEIFDFKLSTEDLKLISALDLNVSSFFDHSTPEGVEIMHNLINQRKSNNNNSSK
ncbi:aldo/keto reductase [Spiroplasma endosymbiont of Aspidapion aeneum]|uniref:aldo/keto reductase n=1 Tax=Spiroplasma endosymbiont of Aspidapion aeneum TaxID=3066276 RepID=UPI00313EAD5A